MPPQKLVIIGIDAGDFRLARRLMDAGELPALSALRERGWFSRLESTIPAQTAPAWTSITTGVNPGKHGIFYFYNFATSPISITNATNTKTPRIWDYVGAAGFASVVVNVPVTYPAQRVTGSIVAGIPPWFLDGRSVYPGELGQSLKAAGYEIDAPMSRGLERKPELLVDRILAAEKKRVGLFLDLVSRTHPTFGMVVMTGLDRLQHKLVGKGKEEDEAVDRAYREVDSLVGKIVEVLGPEVNYLVVSDHGYNSRPVAFYPNSWLYERGLLKRRSSIRNRMAMAAHDLFDGHLLWLPQRLTKRFQGATTVVHTIDAVDLEASRAFVPGTDGVMVVKSREDEGEIVSGLSGLRDEDGNAVCTVYTREQVYRGERAGEAPEILMVPNETVNIRTDPFSRKVLSREGSFAKGNHGPGGIFFAAGPGVAKPKEAAIAIEDVAPTALHLMRIRPPDTMDGRAAEPLLSDPGTSDLVSPVMGDDQRGKMAFTEEEERQVTDNLKRLGYA